MWAWDIVKEAWENMKNFEKNGGFSWALEWAWKMCEDAGICDTPEEKALKQAQEQAKQAQEQAKKAEVERVANAPNEATRIIEEIAAWRTVPGYVSGFSWMKRNLIEAIKINNADAVESAKEEIRLLFD